MFCLILDKTYRADQRAKRTINVAYEPDIIVCDVDDEKSIILDSSTLCRMHTDIMFNRFTELLKKAIKTNSPLTLHVDPWGELEDCYL